MACSVELEDDGVTTVKSIKSLTGSICTLNLFFIDAAKKDLLGRTGLNPSISRKNGSRND